MTRAFRSYVRSVVSEPRAIVAVADDMAAEIHHHEAVLNRDCGCGSYLRASWLRLGTEDGSSESRDTPVGSLRTLAKLRSSLPDRLNPLSER